MANGEISYNGYQFSEYSHVNVSAEMVEDDAQRTVVYHRYKLRVETIIVAEYGDANVGIHFQRMRQKLSKAGQRLVIDHAGFGPRLDINATNYSAIYDVAFGPKPRMISWNPVGATNAVEVVWECEFCIPTCSGLGGVRYTGLSQLNYGISYRIDKYGYTTRTISGYLEIAMTRRGLNIPDTADAYRDVVVVAKPVNYERETSWDLSQDKRRANFTITDSEIRSPNAFPEGVINIRASHRVSWSKRHLSHLYGYLTATIELAHNQPRGRAWAIFQNLVNQRFAFSIAENSGREPIRTSLDVEEEVYGTGISFALTYEIIPNEGDAYRKIFTATGLLSTVADWQQWQAWSNSIGTIQTHRGRSLLAHNPSQDRLVDLCADATNPETPNPYFVAEPPPTGYPTLCNPKPTPDKSYIRFQGWFTAIENNYATEQITIGGDDLNGKEFDPSDPSNDYGATKTEENIERYIEEAPAGIEFQWKGYCQRLGYDIPKPGKLKFGDVTLVRKGKGIFRKRFIGSLGCQPLYEAAWVYRYIVDRRPSAVSSSEANPVNKVGAST